jgi:hypothetical protein
MRTDTIHQRESSIRQSGCKTSRLRVQPTQVEALLSSVKWISSQDGTLERSTTVGSNVSMSGLHE